ncbi:MAG: hypothetical protein MUQ30_08620 [Anaerolineae bacterium]|nr:hypothetical protein [Anaerolineae bacterium]
MAGYIPQGPSAVVTYLNAIAVDGIVGRTIGDRQRVALRVITYARDRIRDQEATFGDLSWAQEAIHDLFYTDVEGTPEEEVALQITPGMANLLRRTESLDVWCSTAQQLATLAATLAPGGELMASTWTVAFNSAFEDLEEQGIATRSPMEVNIDGQTVRITRINAATKPRPQDINPDRDHRSGHQIMVMRDNVQDGPLRLYEPEAARSGQHLGALDPGAMGDYFQDLPDIEAYS